MLEICKAQNNGDDITPNLYVQAKTPFPSCLTPKEAHDTHVRQGKKLFEALIHSLAGGTIDALTVELLKHTASQLVIPYKMEVGND